MIFTRFAPSPTGSLHLGNARTALFNWAYARNQGGRFIIRFEDTDKERSSEAHMQSIKDDLTWLGLDYDEIMVQSDNADRHIEVARQLLDNNFAYESNGAIRFKAFADGLDVVLHDKVKGDVKFEGGSVEDFVILRSDGTPTYTLACAVDDFDSGITHVIRGDDHVSNTAKQMMIYGAMKWKCPKYAHLPLIHDENGKLSKRSSGSLAYLQSYKSNYLPSAMVNYLARLGWSHGNDEVFSVDQFVKWFSLKGIVSSPARFDIAKLNDTNAKHIRMTDADELVGMIAPNDTDKLAIAMPEIKTRCKTIDEIRDMASYLIDESWEVSIPMDCKVHLQSNFDLVANMFNALKSLNADEWTRDNLKSICEKTAIESNHSLNDASHVIRCAVAGRLISHSAFTVLEAAGMDTGLSRLNPSHAWWT